MISLSRKIFNRITLRFLCAAACGVLIMASLVSKQAIHADLQDPVHIVRSKPKALKFPESEEKLEKVANDFLKAEGLETIAPAAGTEDMEPALVKSPETK